MSDTAKTDSQQGRYFSTGPPRPSQPFIAHSGHVLRGDFRHSSHSGRQTGENPCGLTFAFLALIGADLTAFLGEGLPVFLAGDLNAKLVGWNSRMSTRRGKLLRNYADEICCRTYGPDTPTTNPCNSFATPHILDIIITKNLSSPV
jgi:hypothetical protein